MCAYAYLCVCVRSVLARLTQKSDTQRRAFTFPTMGEIIVIQPDFSSHFHKYIQIVAVLKFVFCWCCCCFITMSWSIQWRYFFCFCVCCLFRRNIKYTKSHFWSEPQPGLQMNQPNERNKMYTQRTLACTFDQQRAQIRENEYKVERREYKKKSIEICKKLYCDQREK